MERHDIDGDETVGQLLGRRPAATSVFLRRGMACPGCGMAPFESLAEVASVYGQELSGFLADLAAAPEGGPAVGSPVGAAVTRSRTPRPRRR